MSSHDFWAMPSTVPTAQPSAEEQVGFGSIVGDAIKSAIPGYSVVEGITDMVPEGGAVPLAAGVGAGATFGATNVAERYARGGIDYALSDDPDATFQAARDRILQIQGKRAEDFPGTTMAGEVIGALISGKGALKAGEMAAPKILSAVQGSKTGRILGAGAYAGGENAAIRASTREDQNLMETGKDVGIGAAGGVLGQSVMDVAVPMVKNLFGYVAPAFGASTKLTGAERMGRERAENVMTGRGRGTFAGNQDFGPDESLLQKAREMPEDNLIGDIPGASTILNKTLADPATNATTRRIRDEVKSRIASADDDANMLITESFGKSKGKVQTAKQYNAERSVYSSTYDDVFNASVARGEAFSVKDVLATIRKDTPGSVPKKTGVALKAVEDYIKSSDILSADGVIDARSLLALKKTLDDLIVGDPLTAVSTDTRNALLNAKKNVNKMLGTVEGYSDIATKYADNFSQEANFKLGADMFKANKYNADEIGSVYRKLTSPEQRAFRSGMLEQVNEMALNAGDPQYVNKTFMKGDNRQRQKMVEIFGADQVDEAMDAANNYVSRLTNAKNWDKSLGSRPIQGGDDTSLLGALNAAAIVGTNTVGNAGTATTAGLFRNLASTLEAPARAETRAVTSLLSKPKQEGIEALTAMELSRNKRLGARNILPGIAGGVGLGSLMDQ